LPSPVTVKIKVQPYQKKFLIAKSENKAEPLVFSRNSPYWKLLVDNVTNYNHLTSFPIDDKEYVFDYFRTHWKTCEAVEIQLPYNEYKNVLYYNYLPRDNQKLIISKIKLDIYHELYWDLLEKRRKGVQRKDIIIRFFEKYDINDDDISLESFYRYTSRILQAI